MTGFHFYPNGAVHIASWGHGLWYLDRTSGCSKTDPPYWGDRFPPVVEPVPASEVLARMADRPPPPRGIADPRIAKLFVTTDYPASGVAGVGPDHRLQVSGRNFPAGQEVTLLIRTGELLVPLSSRRSVLKQSVRVGRDGTFSTSVQLPRDLPHGSHTVEAIGGPDAKVLSVADFFKSYAADEGDEEGRPR